MKSKQKNLLFMGDSLTAGVLSGPVLDYNNMSYPKYIKEYFEKNDQLSTYINFAVSGFETKDVYNQMINNISFNENLLFNTVGEFAYKLTLSRGNKHSVNLLEKDITIIESIVRADILCMTLGSNDFLQYIVHINKNNYKVMIKKLLNDLDFTKVKENLIQNYKYILKGVLSLNPNIKIYVVSSYVPFKEGLIARSLKKPLKTAQESVLLELKEEFKDNIVIIDVFDHFYENKSKYIDELIDIHPNEKGYKYIADQIIKDIKKDNS